MSARDVVLIWMTGQAAPIWDPDDPNYQRASKALDDLLREHAHELAEQQRNWARDHGVPLEDDQYVTAGDVIDLIDPAVTS